MENHSTYYPILSTETNSQLVLLHLNLHFLFFLTERPGLKFKIIKNL